jgi:hypothetical protein
MTTYRGQKLPNGLVWKAVVHKLDKAMVPERLDKSVPQFQPAQFVPMSELGKIQSR